VWAGYASTLKVPLGVIDENETSYEEMTRILENLRSMCLQGYGEDRLALRKVDTREGGDLLLAIQARGVIYVEVSCWNIT
jgi:hypothetical protein